MGGKRRRTPQEKKALSYDKDTRGHFHDSPNVKFSRKLMPIRKAQETRRRRRVYNARTRELVEIDDEVMADIEAGELEQDLGTLGHRGQTSYGPWSLREHVADREPNRQARREWNARVEWVTCETCGRRHKVVHGLDD